MEVEKYLSYQALSPCSNKYLQRLWDQEYYNDHRLRVLLGKVKKLSYSRRGFNLSVLTLLLFKDGILHSIKSY